MHQLQTPVLMLVFNRPEETKRVFNSLRLVKPKTLFVAADGPRSNRPGDKELCEQTRQVFNSIDWPCEVKTLYRENNLSCGPAVSQALTWFFDQVEEGIVLEDDCLPDATFFSFCENMLERYRHTPEIMHIGGINFQKGRKHGEGSYYFSMYTHVWGWASWKRAWNQYDYHLKSIKTSSDLNLGFYTQNRALKQYWKRILSLMKKLRINTWDYQWNLSVFHQKGISIVPNVNLVSNIGNVTGTHLNKENDTWVMGIPLESLPEITHPSHIKICQEADDFYYEHGLKTTETIPQKIRRLYKKYLVKG